MMSLNGSTPQLRSVRLERAVRLLIASKRFELKAYTVFRSTNSVR
jgi:hypothetical protein